jgi:ABC-type multidrug transport system fused ATPase/permease subunit
MLGYVRPHRWALLAGGVLSLTTTATGLALPLVAKRLVENLSQHRSIAPVLVVMTLLVLGNAGIGAAGSYVLRRTAESVVLAAGKRLVFRLVRLRIPALDHREPGDLMSRVASDTTLLRVVRQVPRRFPRDCNQRACCGVCSDVGISHSKGLP